MCHHPGSLCQLRVGSLLRPVPGLLPTVLGGSRGGTWPRSRLSPAGPSPAPAQGRKHLFPVPGLQCGALGRKSLPMAINNLPDPHPHPHFHPHSNPCPLLKPQDSLGSPPAQEEVGDFIPQSQIAFGVQPQQNSPTHNPQPAPTPAAACTVPGAARSRPTPPRHPRAVSDGVRCP